MIDSDNRDCHACVHRGGGPVISAISRIRRPCSRSPTFPLRESPYNAVRLGYLLAHLRHNPLQTVVDFGAGMCWLTIGLQRTGCRVVALDVSKAALELGERAFREARLPAGDPDAAVSRLRRLHVSTRGQLRRPDRVLRRAPSRAEQAHRPARDVPRAASGRPRLFRRAGAWTRGVRGRGSTTPSSGVSSKTRSTPPCSARSPARSASAKPTPCRCPIRSTTASNRGDFRRLRLGERRRVLDWSGNDALIVFIKDAGRDRFAQSAIVARLYHRRGLSTVVGAWRGHCGEPPRHQYGRHALARAAAQAANGPLDYAAAFLDKAIVPGAFTSTKRRSPATASTSRATTCRAWSRWARVCGTSTCGIRSIWITDAGFLRPTSIRANQPKRGCSCALRNTPGLYGVTFDVVDEYLTWLQSEGSPHRDRIHPGRRARACRRTAGPRAGSTPRWKWSASRSRA